MEIGIRLHGHAPSVSALCNYLLLCPNPVALSAFPERSGTSNSSSRLASSSGVAPSQPSGTANHASADSCFSPVKTPLLSHGCMREWLAARDTNPWAQEQHGAIEEDGLVETSGLGIRVDEHIVGGQS